MKLVIAGSRGVLVPNEVIQHIISDKNLVVSLIVSGGCNNSPDESGAKYARDNHISLSVFPADWNKHGNAAGPLRNKEMAEFGDALFAFWDGKSRGTKNMMDHMHRRKKPVYVANCTITTTDDHSKTTIEYNGTVFEYESPRTGLARSMGCSD